MTMSNAALRLLLIVGAMTALAVATGILFLPELFYASYGIDPSGNISLLNELKAPAVAIMLASGVMASALTKPKLLPFALFSGVLVFLCFGLGRVIAVMQDGMPSTALIWVAAIEVMLGLFFAWGLLRSSTERSA